MTRTELLALVAAVLEAGMAANGAAYATHTDAASEAEQLVVTVETRENKRARGDA